MLHHNIVGFPCRSSTYYILGLSIFGNLYLPFAIWPYVWHN